MPESGLRHYDLLPNEANDAILATYTSYPRKKIRGEMCGRILSYNFFNKIIWHAKTETEPLKAVPCTDRMDLT